MYSKDYVEASQLFMVFHRETYHLGLADVPFMGKSEWFRGVQPCLTTKNKKKTRISRFERCVRGSRNPKRRFIDGNSAGSLKNGYPFPAKWHVADCKFDVGSRGSFQTIWILISQIHRGSNTKKKLCKDFKSSRNIRRLLRQGHTREPFFSCPSFFYIHTTRFVFFGGMSFKGSAPNCLFWCWNVPWIHPRSFKAQILRMDGWKTSRLPFVMVTF